MEAVLQVFSYLSKHIQSKPMFDPIPRDWSHRDWSHPDWKEFYPDAVEKIPRDMPIPLGKPIHMIMFCDASHASDLVTHHPTTGFLIYLCGALVVWYSTRQNAVESSTFGYEFVALGIATEKVEALRIKLHQFAVPLDGPCNTFVDNENVVTQTTTPESTLVKKHNGITYHKLRESLTMGVQRICLYRDAATRHIVSQHPCMHAYTLKQCNRNAFTSDRYAHKIC
jgi:hypothetical protein